ncbi:site-specific DNA-methyltransferase [Treponema sp. HNW]|uniref:site-specific DNA-methyltransferase n=1 Tax=Treponema sp. HNW TaxID=3116654 RepID=UPI003D0D02D6
MNNTEPLSMHTRNKADENFQKLSALFPNAVTESVNEKGEVVRAVDKDVLMQEISCTVVEGREERYQFTWPDKKKAILAANSPISKTLRPCREESVNFDTTENLYIEGDNLDVLKLLQETYLGKIKMIYIDPPYNTGKDFVYRDNFAQSADEYLENSGQFDEEGNRLFQNTESNGRFHSDWLNMIYPRLKLARDLLSDDGVIFISIDDNEVHNLKKICDEVFGEINFVASFIWEKTQHFGRQKLNSYCNSEYILSYGKNIFNNGLKELFVENIKDELLDAPLYNDSNNVNVLTFPKFSTKFNIEDGIYEKTTSRDYELLNPVTVKDGTNNNEFNLKFKSRWSNKTVQKEIEKGTRFWVKTETFAIRAIYGENRYSTDAPRQIIFTNSRNPMVTKNRFGNKVDTNENATKSLNQLLAGTYFSYPKPTSLIEYFISVLYNERDNQYENNYYILDFFSGSATTAHAVMQLNAEDSGNRKFIMVQLPEETDEKSEANKAGYKNICEIGKERIRRAGAKIKEDNKDKEGIENLDIGFRVLKCDSSNMKDVYYTPERYTQKDLIDLADNIKNDRSAEDLLFQVMLDLGILLSSKIEKKEVDGKTLFSVEDNYLIACFDDDITDEVITEIAKKKPSYFVMRDASAAQDSVTANFDQIFAAYSPDTVRKVL